MKKYLGILAGAALLLGMAACDDSNDYEAKTSTLEIVSSDLSFTSLQDTGYVKVTSPTSITAKTSASWCNVTVDNLSVRVIVSQSPDLESRNAMLTIYNATDSVNIPINQLGRVFYIDSDTTAWLVNADGSSQIDLAAKLTTDYTVTSTDSWVHTARTSTGFRFTFDAYSSGTYRKAKVTIKSPYGDEVSFWFGQKDPNADLASLGNYHFWYYDYYAGEQEIDCTLSYDSSTKRYTLGGVVDEGNLTMTYNSTYKCYALANGQYIGTWAYNSTTYYLYTATVNTSLSTVGYSTTAAYSTFFAETVDDEGNYAIALTQAGTVVTSPAGFFVNAFKAKSFTSANNSGAVYTFLYPALILQPND